MYMICKSYLDQSTGQNVYNNENGYRNNQRLHPRRWTSTDKKGIEKNDKTELSKTNMDWQGRLTWSLGGFLIESVIFFVNDNRRSAILEPLYECEIRVLGMSLIEVYILMPSFLCIIMNLSYVAFHHHLNLSWTSEFLIRWYSVVYDENALKALTEETNESESREQHECGRNVNNARSPTSTGTTFELIHTIARHSWCRTNIENEVLFWMSLTVDWCSMWTTDFNRTGQPLHTLLLRD